MAEGELDPAAKAVLLAYRAQTQRSLSTERRADAWANAVAREARARLPAALLIGLGVAACTAAAAVISGNRSVRARPPAEAPAVEASPGAQWIEDERAVVVRSGRLRLRAHGARRLITPELEADLTNARALVDVAPGLTALTAEEGDVVYRTPKGSWRLAPGVRVTISNAPAPLAVAAVEQASCRDGEEQRSCLVRQSSGLGLAAETALYELGLLDRDRGLLDAATEDLKSYQRRFPEGTFAPEVSIVLMLSLEAEGDHAAAAAEADHFLAVNRGDPRAGEVRKWRLTLQRKEEP